MKQEGEVLITRIETLEVGDKFLLSGVWREVRKIHYGKIHYRSLGNYEVGHGARNTIGAKSKQYVQVERAIKPEIEND